MDDATRTPPTPTKLLPETPRPQRPRTIAAIALALPVFALLLWLGLQPPPKPRNAGLEAPATAATTPPILNQPRRLDRPVEPFPALAAADAQRRLEEAALAQSLGIDPNDPYGADPAERSPYAPPPSYPPQPLGHSNSPPPSPVRRAHPPLVVRAALAGRPNPPLNAFTASNSGLDTSASPLVDDPASYAPAPADAALAALPLAALNLLTPKQVTTRPPAYLSPTPNRQVNIEKPRVATTRRLRAGTIVSAILLTPIDTTLEQTILAQTTRDVWDTSLARILLPAGTRLIGKTSTDVATTQKRALTAWHSAQLADGSSVSLAADPGADALGTAGIPARLNRHFASSLGTATLLAIVGAGAQLSQPRRNNGINPAAITPQETVAGAIGNELAQFTTELLRRDLNRAPLLTVPAPVRFTILVTADTIVGAPQ